MSSKTFVGFVMLLGALAVFQGATIAARLRRGAGPYGPYHPNLTMTPGALVRTTVRDAAGIVKPISSIAPGSCVFAVVYSPTCPACLAAGKLWVNAEDSESIARSLAPAWKVLFVSVGDSAATRSAFRATFPFALFRVEKLGQLEQELGMTAYPSHFVLDRQGHFVQGGVTAPVPPVNAFAPDCTVHWKRTGTDSTGPQGED